MIRRGYRVVCDACLQTYEWEFDNKYETLYDARQQTAESGWTHAGRRDYCPQCTQKGLGND